MTDRFMNWWGQRPWWQCALAFALVALVFGGSGLLIMGAAAGFCAAPLVYRGILAGQQEMREGRTRLGRWLGGLRDHLESDSHKVEPDRSPEIAKPSGPSRVRHEPTPGAGAPIRSKPLAHTATAAGRRANPVSRSLD